MLALYLTAFAVFAPILLILMLFQFSKGKNGTPPMVTTSRIKVPLIGTLIEFCLNPIATVWRCYDEYGPVFTIPMFHKRLTFLIGPEAQGIFFRATDDVMSQEDVYDFVRPVFGPGVVYDATRRNRQTQLQSVSSGLRVTRLKAYVSKIETETMLYLKKWGNEGELDLLDALSELTILTASRCLHGNDVREQMFAKVSKLYHDLDSGITPLAVFWPDAPIPSHFKRNRARLQLVKLFGEVIKNRKENKGVGSDGTDILGIFSEIKYKDGSLISNEQITGLLIALLFAGQHTSCITSTWTSLFIANNKDILRRVVEEQNEIFKKDKSANLDLDKLNEMELLHNCMREALRLCPPLVLLIRKAMKEISFEVEGKSYIIPKDDMVFVSPSVGMRLESAFPEPEKFDPDRFAAPREEHKIPYAYLAFGGGMHSCMGQNFAFVQVKAILSVLFREYDIELIAPKLPEINYAAMVVGPKGDCRIKYKKR